MKSRKKVFYSLVSIIIILGILTLFLNVDYNDGHIKRNPDITGTITLVIDETTVILDKNNSTLEYKNNSLKNIELIDMIQGSFQRGFGEYGSNEFTLYIKPQCLGSLNKKITSDLGIDFGYISSNDWHKVNVELKINISDITDKTFKVSLEQVITGDQESIDNEEYVVDLTNNEQLANLKVFGKFE